MNINPRAVYDLFAKAPEGLTAQNTADALGLHHQQAVRMLTGPGFNRQGNMYSLKVRDFDKWLAVAGHAWVPKNSISTGSEFKDYAEVAAVPWSGWKKAEQTPAVRYFIEEVINGTLDNIDAKTLLWCAIQAYAVLEDPRYKDPELRVAIYDGLL